MKFKDGSLTNFKQRWGFRALKTHRKSEDANKVGLRETPSGLKKKIIKMDINKVFNPEECGLCFIS